MADFIDSTSPPDGDDSFEELPSSSVSSTSIDEYDRTVDDAEQEWKESLQQLELLLSMVIVPYMGKYFGRKCAYWGWAKFMEWKYPVEVVFTSPKIFKGVGVIEAAASL